MTQNSIQNINMVSPSSRFTFDDSFFFRHVHKLKFWIKNHLTPLGCQFFINIYFSFFVFPLSSFLIFLLQLLTFYHVQGVVLAVNMTRRFDVFFWVENLHPRYFFG